MATLLGSVLWSFKAQRYPDVASFVAAVHDYNMRVVQREPDWNPEEVVIEAQRVRVNYESVRGDAYDFASTEVTTPDPRGFTAGYLLWRLHEALAQENLADHCFFEGLTRVRGGTPPLWELRQGS